ncbi:hypothetical protein MVEN_00475900 [Mycena venus]|uniref:Hydrophobin n=1 Tax=Mycena venus TaxID=2733690 RepID=A0A8H7D8B4_9AGAR|nr:hypothetical protein MVEN_00475300 [Mycena venus]KAF7365995.1 hypothetical protein MVEN_00475400 [Mycena venus]KAF7365999.1 hypothetical protein MVEN_00475800 [Mycena venus]KAF7366000.1 hypothetical protein MVEN_00475900 [Mycena venus]
MFNSKALLASTLAALVSFTVASPAKPSPDAGTTVTACTGSFGTGCLPVSVSFGVCTNLNDALSGEVTSVNVPDGLICTFFEGFGCSDAHISLQQGTYDFRFTNPFFDKQAHSLNCSPQ